MPLDASILPIPAGVRTATTANTPLIPDAKPGDLVFAPEVFRHAALLIDGDDLAVHTLSASNITMAGQDLEALLFTAETDRLRPSVLTDSNFEIGSITTDLLVAPMPVYLGGTGVDTAHGHEGMLAIGAGADAMSFGPGLTWSNADATLHVARAVKLDEFSVSACNGSLELSGPGVTVDLFDYGLGIPPVAAIWEPSPGASDSNAFIDYAVTDGDTDAVLLHVAWYDGDADQPRLPPEVARGIGALSNVTLDLAAAGASGSFTIGDLDPISDYVVRATAEDRRGNLSAVHPITVRTTELSAPVITGIHSYVTEPTLVGFSSSNQPDTSDMLFVAGVLTAATPAITEEDIVANLGLFHSQTVEAGTHVDIARTFEIARDPANAFAGEPIAEARTYHPFVFYKDNEFNAVLRYGDPLYNPDVTPPAFDAALSFVSAATTSLTVSLAVSDAVGVTDVRAYVSLLDGSLAPVTVPTENDVMTHGDAVAATGQTTLYNYHSGDHSAKPLLHTARYRVYVTATDAAGLRVSDSVVAATLDGEPPVIDTFSVQSEAGTGDAVVSWVTSDAGPHASVTAVHVHVTSSDAPLTAEQVRDQATDTFALANSSAVFGGVPAYADTRVHAVAEDDAASFGNAANRLSSVAQGAITVPVVSVGPTYSQPAGTSVVMASVTDGIEAETGPVNVRMVLFNAREPSSALSVSESNAVFTDTEPSAALYNLLFGAIVVAEATAT